MITKAKVLELLEEVVAESPRGAETNYYTDILHFPEVPESGALCNYLTGDQPSCIAGHVFMKLGFTVEQIAKLDMKGDNASTALHILTDTDDYEPAAAIVLLAAQSAQDAGRTWGEALEEARQV